MGIPTDPGYRLYTTDNYCFPSGKTPKKLYITFTGINCGMLWHEGNPDPYNGCYRLESENGVMWKNSDGVVPIIVILAGYGTVVQVGIGEPQQMFYFSTTEQCVFSGNSQIIGDGDYYYGGRFAIVPRD